MNLLTKSLFVFFSLFVISAFSFSSVYAQESKSRSNDGWLLFGYGYSFPESKDKEIDGLQGPATLTIGGDLWRFIGLEVTLGGRWNTRNYIANSYILDSYVPYKATNILWSFDIKPYLLLQPKIGVDMLSLRPYIGVGPSFHFTGLNSTEELLGTSLKNSGTSFDVGFSAKAGLRLQALKFLFVGVGAEYLYHKAKISSKNIDLSGWTVGAEVGFIW